MKDTLEKYFDRLWPICRSITGNGLRESFHILQELIPLELTEVPSGAKVFDWEIPKEWNIKDAYIITPDGKKICEFKLNNLHILNYSIPQNKECSFEELKQHLFYREDLPEAIPYVTSYYKENWGFCISHNEFKDLPEEGTYKIFIDSELKNGGLTYGELVLKGNTDREIIFSSYLCHPSMANNELSGPLALAMLYKKINAVKDRKYTYRFILAPETIGVIAYLAKKGMYMKEKVIAGYVLTCVAGKDAFTYKRSKQNTSLADKAAEHVLKYSGEKYKTEDFSIGGSDERQYCSIGFNLPVGSLIKSKYQEYKEYHTSLDNKSFIDFSALEKTVEMYYNISRAIELNEKYKNLNPFCELQLGKRGLYPTTGGTWGIDIENTRKLLHLLAFTDGETDLIDIAEKRNLSAHTFEKEVQILLEKGLISL
jgi:aminopeptidase-like protein